MATSRRNLPPNLKLTKDSSEKLRNSLLELVDQEVLVGFPEESSAREGDDEDEKKGPITNAALAYIHDNGQPEVNIPARPFMIPAIESIREKVADKLERITRGVVIRGAGPAFVQAGLTQIGFDGEMAIKNKINEGVPPPLADATLRERARKGRKGAKEELARRAKGEAPGTDLAKPLVDSAQMRNSAKYVIRSRSQRKE